MNIYAVRESYFLLVLFLECQLPFPLHVSMPLHWPRQSLGKLAQMDQHSEELVACHRPMTNLC